MTPAQRKDNTVERLTEERIQQWFDAHAHPDGMGDCQFCDDPWPCYWHQANLLLQDTRDELATLRSQHATLRSKYAEVLGAVREMIKAIALAEQVELRELGYVVTRGVTDESPQSWWDSQSWPIYHAIVALVTLAQEGQ